MITEKTVISGTEEELLAYFKQKYNLVESDLIPTQEAPKQEAPKEELKPANVNSKVTTGFGNLFGGTSWGK